MMPVFVAFFTSGTMYEQEADRLAGSLDRLDIPYDIQPVADRGSWSLNASMTPAFICDMLDKYKGQPIVYVNADAYLWQHPVLFESLSPDAFDIALHVRQGKELLNGTVWLGNTPACRELMNDYRERVGGGDRNEQRHLQDALVQRMDAVRRFDLPASYCWIHDIMADDIGDEKPVIEQLQASRAMTRSSLLPNRVSRLQTIEHDRSSLHLQG